MAKHLVPRPRKQRTRGHILADLSANHVARFALRCGFAVECLQQDYGIDLAVFTFDAKGFLESGVIWLQLKATDSVKTARTGNSALIRLERRDILAWIRERYPVILDAEYDRAYWLSIQAYFGNRYAFSKLRGETVTVRVPLKNAVDEDAIRAFAREKSALLGH